MNAHVVYTGMGFPYVSTVCGDTSDRFLRRVPCLVVLKIGATGRLKTGESRRRYISIKRDMNDLEFVKCFVSEREINDNGIKRESCLKRALEDAKRLYSKEDTLQEIVLRSHNQEYNHERDKQLMYQMNDIPFLSLVGYLILLDLIGEVFTKKRKDSNNITNAIDYFGSEKLKECKWTVNALRNSLAHNYGLINIPRHKKDDPNSLHKFMLLLEKLDTEIFEKEKDWTRNDWRDKFESTSTKVYMPNLIDEIENLYKKLIEKVEKGDYKIYLKGGIEELKSRFTIIIV